MLDKQIIIKKMTWSTRTGSFSEIICNIKALQIKATTETGKDINELMTLDEPVIICLNSTDTIDKIITFENEDYIQVVINGKKYKINGLDDSYSTSIIYDLAKLLKTTESITNNLLSQALIDYLVKNVGKGE